MSHQEDTFIVEEFEVSDESDDDIFKSDDDENSTSSEEDDEDGGLEYTLRSLQRFVSKISLSLSLSLLRHSDTQPSSDKIRYERQKLKILLIRRRLL